MIAREIKKVKGAENRVIFVLNKCDLLDEEIGETVARKVKEIKQYLNDCFGIMNPVIIPTNAYLAMVIQKVRKGDKLGKRERIEYDWIKECICENNLHFEDYALVDQDIKDEIKEQLTRYKKENDKESVALIHTGIPIIKELIRRYTLWQNLRLNITHIFKK